MKLFQSTIKISFAPHILQRLPVLFFFFLSGILHAQIDTTTVADSSAADSTKKEGWLEIKNAHTEYFFSDNPDSYFSIDTTLQSLQVYSAVKRDLFPYAYLGNSGAAYYNRFFTFCRIPGFDYGRHQFDEYLYHIDSVKYYRTNYPFTELYYLLGTASEQYFKIKHAQNIGPRANISLSFDRIASVGFYTHEKNTINDVALSGWYKTKNERYAIYAAGIFNHLFNEENGGLPDDSIFYFTPQNLDTINRDQAHTEWKIFQGQITQVLQFGKKESYAVNDSVTKSYLNPKIRIVHQFSAFNYRYNFEDPSFDQSFYDTIYLPDDTLHDISDVDGFYNRLSVGNAGVRRISHDSSVVNSFRWKAYAEQQLHDINDQGRETIYHNLLAGIQVNNNADTVSKINYAADAVYDLVENTYKASVGMHFSHFAINPSIGFTAGKFTPTVIQNHYYGFTYRWENDFEDITYAELSAGIYLPSLQLRLSGMQQVFRNYIYFTEGVDPQQEKEQTTSVTQFLIEKNFILGNFHLNNRFGVQFINSDHIPMPDYLARISWYYERNLFGSALFMQAGIDGWYVSDYEGYAYNFITGQFGMQSPADTKVLSFYPVLDAFVNFDIRSFRFFLKGENLTQDLFSKGYFEAPEYPMQERSFKLGFSWYLFY